MESEVAVPTTVGEAELSAPFHPFTIRILTHLRTRTGWGANGLQRELINSIFGYLTSLYDEHLVHANIMRHNTHPKAVQRNGEKQFEIELTVFVSEFHGVMPDPSVATVIQAIAHTFGDNEPYVADLVVDPPKCV